MWYVVNSIYKFEIIILERLRVFKKGYIKILVEGVFPQALRGLDFSVWLFHEIFAMSTESNVLLLYC